MIAMFMRNQNRIQLRRIDPDRTQAFFHPAGRYPGVNQEFRAAELKEDGIARAAAR